MARRTSHAANAKSDWSRGLQDRARAFRILSNNTEGCGFLCCPGVRTRAPWWRPLGHPSGAPLAPLGTPGGRSGTGGVAAQGREEGPPAPASARRPPAHETRDREGTTTGLGVRAWTWAAFPASVSTLPVAVFPQNSTSAVINAAMPLLLKSGCATRDHTHVLHNFVCVAVMCARHKSSGPLCYP